VRYHLRLHERALGDINECVLCECVCEHEGEREMGGVEKETQRHNLHYHAAPHCSLEAATGTAGGSMTLRPVCPNSSPRACAMPAQVDLLWYPKVLHLVHRIFFLLLLPSRSSRKFLIRLLGGRPFGGGAVGGAHMRLGMEYLQTLRSAGTLYGS
jgi:hypothetical protein